MLVGGMHETKADMFLNRSCRQLWRPATQQLVLPPFKPSNLLLHSYRNRVAELRTAATHSSGGLPSDSPALSLERAIGERQSVDSALWATGAFHAQVYPDLPFAATWVQLAEKLLNRSKDTDAPTTAPQTGRIGGGGLIVKTVGAQCRSRDHLRDLMRNACSVEATDTPAGALLLVSGSHPARQLPFARSVLQSSFSMLKDAQAMRLNGQLPSTTSLWAVENPILPPERLQAKIDAGAEVILTQPPFARATAERWFQSASDKGVDKAAKILAGVPMASSVSNLEFWMRLCGLGGSPEAEAVLRSFPVAGKVKGGKPELVAAVREWNAEFVRWVLQLPGVGGLHVMPLTKAGRDMTSAFLADGTLPSKSIKQQG